LRALVIRNARTTSGDADFEVGDTADLEICGTRQLGRTDVFQRKPKNRAFERRHVLDVKVARREARRMRVRVATLAVSLSLGTLFALYLLWRAGDWGMNHFVYENKAFAIQDIDIQTDGVMAVNNFIAGAVEARPKSFRARSHPCEARSRTRSRDSSASPSNASCRKR
jgi:hypothetical protein